MKCIKDSSVVCLPDINECESLAEWNAYLEKLYKEVFKPNFVDSHPMFKEGKVYVRREPKDGEWEHGFTHMTHTDLMHTSSDPNDRVPDIRRSERLNWVKPIIEHYKCSVEKKCEKILYWEELFRGRIRINLLFKEERFLVVLEKKKDIYFIITSFYIEKDWSMKKKIRKYEQYKKQKTPLA